MKLVGESYEIGYNWRMNTCKTCAWWRPNLPSDPGSLLAWCQEIESGQPNAKCLNKKMVHSSDGDGVSIEHDGGMGCLDSVWIETGPNFGCVHWQAKPIDLKQINRIMLADLGVQSEPESLPQSH